MGDWKMLAKKLAVYKYPLLLLFIGVFLLLFPSNAQKSDGAVTVGETLEELLTESTGVGRIRVIVSETGAVVVCDGADNAAVRLDILRAIGSYTGFGSDRITVLKMADLKGR